MTEAARDIFVESGFGGARTKDIAERAGVAEGLIFKHFGSKEGLFRAALLEPLQELVAEMAATAGTFESMDPDERMEQSTRLHDRLLEIMTEVVPLLGVVLFSERAGGQRFYEEQIVPLLEQMSAAAAQAMQRSWGREAIDPRLVARVMWGTYLALSLDEAFGEPLDHTTAARELTAILTWGTGGL